MGNRHVERTVTLRPHVGIAEREESEAGRSPRSDAGQPEELLAGVAQLEALGVEGSLLDAFREQPDVPRLLPRESVAPKFVIGRTQDRGGFDRSETSFESLVRSRRRSERDLLFEDEADQRCVGRRSTPVRWRSILRPENSEPGVERPEGLGIRSVDQSRFSLMRVALPTRSRR